MTSLQTWTPARTYVGSTPRLNASGLGLAGGAAGGEARGGWGGGGEELPPSPRNTADLVVVEEGSVDRFRCCNRRGFRRLGWAVPLEQRGLFERRAILLFGTGSGIGSK
ncbi:hypothetical protein Sjap_007687 [Stephania japonica]|uniref:Uncharacterized protein n=1 Tax=Stephania japonica TaxID=461633 RepID=A0AAP0PA65_9MAGN